MICLQNRKHGLKFITVWLYNGDELPKADIYVFIQSHIKPSDNNYTEFFSLFTDLTQNKDVILSKIEKECRYEIRKSKKDGVTCEAFGFDEPIPDEIIFDFVEFNAKYAKKHYDNMITYNDISRLNKFVITRAKIDGGTLVYHGFLHDGKQVRQSHTASLYLDSASDNKSRNMIGRAGRHLYEYDLLAFKNHHFSFFDYAGISDRPEIQNITAYKKQFGGEQFESYCYTRYQTMKAKIYRFAVKMKEIISNENIINQ